MLGVAASRKSQSSTYVIVLLKSWRYIAGVAVVAILLACSIYFVRASWKWSAPQLPDSPFLNGTECPFRSTFSVVARCGYLRIESTDERSRVFFSLLRFRGLVKGPNRALLFIPGGPGVSASNGEDTVELWEDTLMPLSAEHDLVIFDPPGTGFSEPQLECYELSDSEVLDWRVNATVEQETGLLFNVLRDCVRRMRAQQVDFADLSTTATASVASGLMEALNYESWVIYAVSYGTRVAQRLETRAPIDALVLDSFEPASRNALQDVVDAHARMLDMLRRYCDSTAACVSQYGDIQRKAIVVAASLDQKPIMIESDDALIVVNGHRLLSLLYQAMSRYGTTELLPWTMDSAYGGNYEPLRGLIAAMLAANSEQSVSEFISGWAVDCNDHGTSIFDESPSVDERLVSAAYSVSRLKLLCDEIIDPTLEAPIASAGLSVPTLVLSGEYDVVTPPRWAIDWVDTAQTAQWMIFQRTAHNVILSSDCAFQTVVAFISAPTDWILPECARSETIARTTFQ